MPTPPGWYPDPKPGATGLRWWDGGKWTDSVAPQQLVHTGHPPAPPTAISAPLSVPMPAPKPKRLRKAGRRISWMAIATFIVLAGVVGYAMNRGQDVEYVDFKSGKVGFIGSKRVEVAKVEDRSSELEQRVRELEDEAQDRAADTDTDTNTDPDTDTEPAGGGSAVHLTGDWAGESGFHYRIEQYGDEVVVSEVHTVYGVTGYGQGSFDGDTLSMDFVAADGSTGHADLDLDGPDRLRGTFVNYSSGARVTAVLTRI